MIMRFDALFATILLAVCAQAADSPQRLWSGHAPGETAPLGEEKDNSKPGQNLVAGKPVIRLGPVSDPMLQVFRPAEVRMLLSRLRFNRVRSQKSV